MKTAARLVISCFAMASTTVPVLAQQSGGPNGQRPQTLEQLDSAKPLEKALDTIDRLKVLVDRMSREKKTQCIRAFADEPFCACLTEKLPVGASFATYIQVVITTKDQLNYSALTPEDKTIVDGIVGARETCVSERQRAR